jgi:N-acetyl sugar amidotransferase
MQVCKKCLYGSYHPLNITFDDNGICSGCLVHDEKDVIDWAKKEKELKVLVNAYKSKNKGLFDCIVPVSGSRDSFFIVDYVVNVLGLHPLLVTYNKQFNTKEGFYNLALIKRKFDCDLITKTVDPATVKKITRATLRRFGSIYWHCIAGQTVFPVEAAITFQAPLIIWGAHQGLDQVGMFSHHDQVEMSRKYRKNHDLMGYEAEDLISDFDFLTEEDVEQFKYPRDSALDSSGVRGIYLNNYVRWDTFSQHMKMRVYGQASRKQARSFDTYSNSDCYMYADLHDHIKYLKHGYGVVVDHAVRDIRLGHISRDEGINAISQYLNSSPRYKHLFLDWLGLETNAFDYLLDQHRSPSVWARSNDWKWQPDTLNLSENLNSSKKNTSQKDEGFNHFPEVKPIISQDPDEQFLLYGKGS